ncbi:unnamed protein product, partial [Brachionus calyciflorus]
KVHEEPIEIEKPVVNEMNLIEKEFQKFFPDGNLQEFVQIADYLCTNMTDSDVIMTNPSSNEIEMEDEEDEIVATEVKLGKLRG